MKQLKYFALFIILLITTSRGFAQKIELIEGDLSSLKGQKSIDFAFTYDSMTMGGKGHPTEADYVTKKTAEYNKKEAGKGDTWAKEWKDDRESMYQPAFTKMFQQMSGLEMSAKAKYILIFKTTYTEPGFNIMVHQEPSQINGVAWIVESGNKSHVIAKIGVTKARGRNFWGNEFNTGERLTEAYEAAGSQLGYWVRSKM
jgi:hypothetical protein